MAQLAQLAAYGLAAYGLAAYGPAAYGLGAYGRSSGERHEPGYDGWVGARAIRFASASGSGGLRRFHHGEFSVQSLVAAKGATTVSVCLPARDEAATVGDIVALVRCELMERAHLVDEVVVVDDRSVDATAEVAASAGARVVESFYSPPSGSAGKGGAMATALAACTGDVVVFLDADVTNFAAHFVTGLLGPLLCDPAICFVKATYRRPLGGVAGEGGRVTQLVARPLLEALLPSLAEFDQPLAGECAGRRCVLEPLSLVSDYGVDVALLIDVAANAGLGAMAQVDLGERVHRNRSLAELAPQARSVVRAILGRAGFGGYLDPVPEVAAGTRDRPLAPMPPTVLAGHEGLEGL